MPNHVTNRIAFYGNQSDIDKILEYIKGEDTCIDFSKIIPMPKSLMLPSSSDTDIAIQYALSKKGYSESIRIKKIMSETPCSFYKNYYNKVYFHRPFGESADVMQERARQFEQRLRNKEKDMFDSTDYEGLGIGNFEDLGNAYINNIINYGCTDWYDWSYEHWGTKWNAYSVELDEEAHTILFDTAWSCPLPVLTELSKLCYKYNVAFIGEWADEDAGCNVGFFESDGDGDEHWFNHESVENNSNEAFDIYTELKGNYGCLGKDTNGNWIRYSCDDCPNPC